MHSPTRPLGRRLFLQLTAALLLILTSAAFADQWDDRFHTIGVDGVARAHASLGSDLYVGGPLQSAGPLAVSNVAHWDGTAWHALGPGLDGPVHALTFMDGDLYACGQFTHAGPLAVNRVARWDGSQWHAVGAGLPSAPAAMAVYDGGLWCDGWRWDGNAWTEVVTFDDLVSDLIVHDGRLIFGGRFTAAGGAPASYVVAWDGSQLAAMPDQPQSVVDLEVVGASLYALADSYGEADPVTTWTGASWAVVGDLPQDFSSHYLQLMNHDGQLRMMATVSMGPGPFWWTDIATWDGAVWTWLDQVYNMAYSKHCFVHDGDLVLTGRFTRLHGTIAHSIGRLTASGPVALGAAGLGFGGSWGGTVADLCVTPAGMAVGGNFDSVGPVITSGVALWDGATWQPHQAGSAKVAVLVWHDGALHAFYWAGNVIDGNLMVWNGSDWDGLTYHGGPLPHVALSWDGRLLGASYDITDWTQPGAPVLFAEVTGGDTHSLLGRDGALIAGGAFETVDGVPAHGLAIYADGAWSELAGGVDGTVRCLALHQGDLVAGGSLSAAGGVPVAGVARLSDGVWQALGDQLSGDVLALASYGGFIYAGGDFAVAGEQGRNLARWDGLAWHVVGGGTNHPVHDLAVFDDKLHLSGQFGVVGDVPAARFAIWDGTGIVAVPAAAVASPLRAAPNPFNPSTTVSFDLPRGEQVRLDVVDVRGRRVRTLVDRWLDAGEHQATWDGRDRHGRAAAAGSYLLRLRSELEVRVVKVSLVE